MNQVVKDRILFVVDQAYKREHDHHNQIITTAQEKINSYKERIEKAGSGDDFPALSSMEKNLIRSWIDKRLLIIQIRKMMIEAIDDLHKNIVEHINIE